MQITLHSHSGLGGKDAAARLYLAHAQPKLHRVGVLLLGIADAESFKTELREGLRTSGYTVGRNVAFSTWLTGASALLAITVRAE